MSTKHVRTGGDVLRFGCSVQVECGALPIDDDIRGVRLGDGGGRRQPGSGEAPAQMQQVRQKAARISAST
jgi:hypothetical protein